MKQLLITCFFCILSALTVSAQLKVSSTGKVSVGTTQDAASTLSVGGAGHSNYAAYVNGKAKVTGGIDGIAYQPTSFPSYTTTSIAPALSQLLSLSPVMHNYVFLNTTKHRFSITPQSMNTYFSDLVRTDENNASQINYSELVPVLVYAVQGLYAIAAQYHNIVVSPEGEIAVEPVEEEAEEEPFAARPTMAAQRFAGAKLYQNTPNPFTAQTEIRFNLPDNVQNACIYIFDTTGKTLKQFPVSAGQESVTLLGYELPAGMYLYTLAINGQEVDTKRMILSK